MPHINILWRYSAPFAQWKTKMTIIGQTLTYLGKIDKKINHGLLNVKNLREKLLEQYSERRLRYM
jgi:hypothetical protein